MYIVEYCKGIPCLITGAGGCHNSGNPKSEVMVFVEDDSEQTMYIVEYCKGIMLLDYRCWWLP